MSTLTAFGLAVEVGEWERLSGRTIGAFLGLVPNEYSSGESRSRGVDHEDRQRSRAPVADRGSVASPQALPALGRAGAAVGTGVASCSGAGQVREPAAAFTVGGVRRTPEAAGGGEHGDRPGASRMVLVAGRASVATCGLSSSLWVPRTVSRSLISAFAAGRPEHQRLGPAQHDRQLWPSDSAT